jgi:hypothetical protein
MQRVFCGRILGSIMQESQEAQLIAGKLIQSSAILLFELLHCSFWGGYTLPSISSTILIVEWYG